MEAAEIGIEIETEAAADEREVEAESTDERIAAADAASATIIAAAPVAAPPAAPQPLPHPLPPAAAAVAIALLVATPAHRLPPILALASARRVRSAARRLRCGTRRARRNRRLQRPLREREDSSNRSSNKEWPSSRAIHSLSCRTTLSLHSSFAADGLCARPRSCASVSASRVVRRGV